jgi:hypothetical protein
MPGSVPDLISSVCSRDEIRETGTQLLGKECGIAYCVFKKHTTLPVIQFCQCDVSIHTSVVLNILLYRT